MQLSELSGKTVRSGKYTRGVCTGVGISLKSRAVKYLLCSSLPRQINNEEMDGITNENTDFAVSIASVEDISNDEISLSRLRAVIPKNCAKIHIGKPVFSDEGAYLGNVADLHLQNFIATHLQTDKNITHSALSLAACSDVIILRKEQPFPYGQRIPAPLVSHFFDKNDVVVTKSVLQTALQNGMLIRLTLSLSPFQLETVPFLPKKRKWF